jgi:hypothetical protein
VLARSADLLQARWRCSSVSFAVRNAVAAHYLGLDTRRGYEKAVGLEPHNPRNWYLLGRSYLYDLEQPDPVKAVSALRKSVELIRIPPRPA